MRPIMWGTLLVTVLVITTFIFYKPSRILIPEFNGVECKTKALCIDDVSRLEEAKGLVVNAVAAIENRLGPLRRHPKFLFCSSQQCFEKFGFKRAAAHTVGKSAIIIGPRGWMPHYVKHEIIHHWQAENIGVIKMFLVDEWLIEGMAYAMSEDPRSELAPPWQAYRIKFSRWYDTIDQNNLVAAINSIRFVARSSESVIELSADSTGIRGA